MPIKMGDEGAFAAAPVKTPWAVGKDDGPKGGLILAAPGAGKTTAVASYPGKVVDGDTFAWKGLNVSPGWSKGPQADKLREAARAAILRYSGPETVLYWDPALVPWASAVVALPDRQLSQQVDTAKPQEKARREGMTGRESVVVQENLRSAANAARVPVYSSLEEAIETVTGAKSAKPEGAGKEREVLGDGRGKHQSEEAAVGSDAGAGDEDDE